MSKYLTGRICWEGEGIGSTPTPTPAPAPSEHPVTAPWPTEGVWKIGDGDAAKPWYEAIPEESVRKHVEAKQYATPAELAMANYSLTQMYTDPNIAKIPDAEAKPEDWDKFYTKLGRPESADKYDLKFGEGVQTDEGMVKFGKELFYKLGLPQNKAQEGAEMWNGYVAEQNAAAIAKQQNDNTQALVALEQKWGGELEQNKAAGKRVVESLGLPTELIDRVEANIGTAAIVELLATIGRKSDEGKFVASGKAEPNNPATMSKEAAQERINQLRGDVAFEAKYTNPKHPEHAAAVKTILDLTART